MREMTITCGHGSAKAINDARNITNDAQNTVVASPETWRCSFCPAIFPNRAALMEHKASENEHPYCLICDRDFNNLSGVRYHVQQTHEQAQALKCPGCHRHFFKASGLITHFEENQCPNKLYSARAFHERRERHLMFSHQLEKISNQAAVNHILRDVDGNTVIVKGPDPEPNVHRSVFKPGEFPKYQESKGDSSENSSVIDAAALAMVNDYAALERYWDPILKFYKCPYGCSSKKHRHTNMDSFAKHLRSPAHRPKSQEANIRCPACFRQFISAGSLANHVETSTAKCQIKDMPLYANVISELSAGIIKVKSPHLEASNRYEVVGFDDENHQISIIQSVQTRRNHIPDELASAGPDATHQLPLETISGIGNNLTEEDMEWARLKRQEVYEREENLKATKLREVFQSRREHDEESVASHDRELKGDPSDILLW